MPNTQNSQTEARKPSCIQIDAITLRGIGPYFHEARLDIAPITILCGENGSGKSTWFRVLNLLAKANDPRIGKQFPPFFPKHLLPVLNIGRTLINQEAMDDRAINCDLRKHEEHEKDNGGQNGTVQKKTVSFSMLGNSALLDEIKALHDPVESHGPLGTIGLEFTVHEKCAVINNTLNADATDEEKESPSGSSQNEDETAVCEGRFERGDRLIVRISLARNEEWCDEVRLLSLYHNDILWFRIDEDALEVHDELLALFGDTHDASQEGHTTYPWGFKDLHRNLSDQPELLQWVRNQRRGNENLFSCLRLFWHVMDEGLRSFFLLSGNRSAVNDMFLDDTLKPAELEFITRDKAVSRRVGEGGENTLHIERGYADTLMVQELPPKLHGLETDLDAPDKYTDQVVFYHEGKYMVYELPAYVQYWLTKIQGRGLPDFEEMVAPPTGFINGMERTEIHSEWKDYPLGQGIGQPQRFTQGPLRYLASVEGLSAGFNHLLPIIVQTAALAPGELFIIESPEAHMHPASQLRIAEFFLEHHDTGRRFLIETHSDLVVRRVLRAILEEEIAQSDVHIYFSKIQRLTEHPAMAELEQNYKARMEKANRRFHDITSEGAMLDRLRVNDKGQIVNWPEGFLDADVIESRRLIDAMYGAFSEAGEDEEEPSSNDA